MLKKDADAIAALIVKALEENQCVFPISCTTDRPSYFRHVINRLIDTCVADKEKSEGPCNQLTSVFLSTRSRTRSAKGLYNYVCHIAETPESVTRESQYPKPKLPYTVTIVNYPYSFLHLPMPEHAIQKKFLYLPGYKVMYCPVNKAGCSYISNSISGLTSHKAFGYKVEAVPYLPDLISRTSDIFKFTVVRNPYSRVVSSFLDVIGGDTETLTPRHLYFRRCLDLPTENVKIPFADFIQRLEVKGFAWGLGAEHWIPQVAVSSISTIQYDKIGKFENLYNFLVDEIEPELKARGDKRPCIFLKDKPERKSGASVTYKDYYRDTTTVDRVRKLYEVDFDLFKYSYKLD